VRNLSPSLAFDVTLSTDTECVHAVRRDADVRVCDTLPSPLSSRRTGLELYGQEPRVLTAELYAVTGTGIGFGRRARRRWSTTRTARMCDACARGETPRACARRTEVGLDRRAGVLAGTYCLPMRLASTEHDRLSSARSRVTLACSTLHLSGTCCCCCATSGPSLPHGRHRLPPVDWADRPTAEIP
jgi:hypothetical protein